MARMHKGVLLGTCIIVGTGVAAAGVFGFGGGYLWDKWQGEEEKPAVAATAPFKVEYGEEPAVAKEPEKKEEPERHIQLRDKPKVNPARTQREPKREETLTEKWWKKVNRGGMYAFGNDNGYTGTDGGDGECQILQPVRVQAMIADSASTDEPGMAIGALSENVQGQTSDGEWCVALHEGAVVSFHVGKAGDYAENLAPVQVGEMWMEDGFKITVDQPAKYVDGSIGVPGKANHHTVSKTFAAVIGGVFKLADNITSIGQYNVSSGDVSDPFEKMIDRRLNRPAEITFTGGKVAEFDVMPVSTPGYYE